MSRLTPSEILEITPNDAAIILAEQGANSDDFVSAFEKIQDQVPVQCKKCPFIGSLAITVCRGDETIGSALNFLQSPPINMNTCPGADILTIDAEQTVFNEIVVQSECGRLQ